LSIVTWSSPPSASSLDQRLGVIGVARGDGHVDADPLVTGASDVQCRDYATGGLHSRGELADRIPARWNLEPDGDRVRDARQARHRVHSSSYGSRCAPVRPDRPTQGLDGFGQPT
jgi:hypothetical protein